MGLADAIYFGLFLVMMLAPSGKWPKVLFTMWIVNAGMILVVGNIFLAFAGLVIAANELFNGKDKDERVPLTD